MMELTVYDGKLFTWYGRQRLGVTEASQLGLKPSKWPLALAVRSPRTGKVMRFVRLCESKQSNGKENLGWLYRSIEGVELIIIND